MRPYQQELYGYLRGVYTQFFPFANGNIRVKNTRKEQRISTNAYSLNLSE